MVVMSVEYNDVDIMSVVTNLMKCHVVKINHRNCISINDVIFDGTNLKILLLTTT